jgi:hypothetical protein
VNLEIASVDGAPLLRVDDSGPGIAPDERERVLDRFYRIAGSDASGSGLGLPIVKAVAVLHGATLALLPSPQPGRPARRGPLLARRLTRPKLKTRLSRGPDIQSLCIHLSLKGSPMKTPVLSSSRLVLAMLASGVIGAAGFGALSNTHASSAATTAPGARRRCCGTGRHHPRLRPDYCAAWRGRGQHQRCGHQQGLGRRP